MKLIRVIISSACLLLASMAAIPAQAGSSDFSGPYIAISGAVNGGFISGTYTDEDKFIEEHDTDEMWSILKGDKK